jgi:hypothetical protein
MASHLYLNLLNVLLFVKFKTHCEVLNLDNLYQSAHKSGHSTETDLLNKIIKSNIEMSLATAAFDTIDHTT